MFSNCIPSPSLPNNIPTPKNNNNAGTPNLELAFPANMLKKNNTDKTSNTISICKLIFFILKSFLCPHCLSFYTCCQRFAAKKRGAFRSDYLSTETKVTKENKPFGNFYPPHVFLGAVVPRVLFIN